MILTCSAVDFAKSAGSAIENWLDLNRAHCGIRFALAKKMKKSLRGK